LGQEGSYLNFGAATAPCADTWAIEPKMTAMTAAAAMAPFTIELEDLSRMSGSFCS
jgi:hypothetical protein